MAQQCDQYEQCKRDRVESAKFEGTVLNELKNIKQAVEKGFEEVSKKFESVWAEMNINRSDIKALYFRVGLISGGTSLIVSLVVSLVVKGMGK